MATGSSKNVFHVFALVFEGEEALLQLLSFSDLKIKSHNDHYVPLLPDLIFGTTSVVHFHHVSTHTTYGT